jgi:hypothetical protein
MKPYLLAELPQGGSGDGLTIVETPTRKRPLPTVVA